MKYVCDVCGWVYDEEETGVKFEDLPEDFECPLCGVGKDQFSPRGISTSGNRANGSLFFIRVLGSLQYAEYSCKKWLHQAENPSPLAIFPVFR